jgi:hypothetical protein
MKLYKYLLSLVFLSAISCSVDAAPATKDSSIAYRDSYIWYLANQMATPLLNVLFLSKPLLPADRAQFDFELSLLYHHALIDCKGPLDEISAALKFSFLSDKKTATTVDTDNVLFALGSTKEVVQPILDKWNIGVLSGIIETFKAGKATTAFPVCMNSRYTVPAVAGEPSRN